MKLGVALGAHTHPFETLLELVRHAEERGFDVAYADGDVSMLSRRTEVSVLDGWTVSTALLARTERIAIGSLRLPHHWNAARLAQATATAHHLFGDRFRFFASAGAQPIDHRFGLDWGGPGERVARLDETLEAVRALWRGETVTREGRFVRLDGARIRPTPPGGGMPIELAGRGRRLLSVVARHGDLWDVNWPPIRRRVEQAAAFLREACEREGRDPAAIARSQWIFTRVVARPDEAALEAEFREINPWFAEIPSDELREGWVAGEPARCRDRIREIHQVLGIDLPILDLTGLDAPASRAVMDALEDLADRH
jgi:alkanesulfonate monooxygenase SsuD/methylene tetrahydromethanopterin reductase-like flavin-dependent oxidoreductase (luciferase family)